MLGESNGQRVLAGNSPCGHKAKSWLWLSNCPPPAFFMLRGGALCATVHGVTKTWTQSSKRTTDACCLVTQWMSDSATPCTAAPHACLPFTISQTLFKLMLTDLIMHPIISSSVVSFSFLLQSLSGTGSFPMSLFFTSGDQSFGASASVSVILMSIKDWFPLGFIGLISLQSKGLSKVFSNTIAQKHQFFSIWPYLWSNIHIHTWLP